MIPRHIGVAALSVGLVIAGLAGLVLPGGLGGALSGGQPATTVTPTPGSQSMVGMGDMNGMGMDMRMVENGTIVNENPDKLPPGCDAVAGNRSVTIAAGRSYAAGGEMFAFDTEWLEVDPCTRLTVTFVNEDAVRHQWMLHGLPTETYPMGMFNIEVLGPGQITATLITPSQSRTFHTHCSLPQHEQKGMHMALVVGEGSDSGHDYTHTHG